MLPSSVKNENDKTSIPRNHDFIAIEQYFIYINASKARSSYTSRKFLVYILFFDRSCHVYIIKEQ